jgi:hypothetical protein
VYYSILDIWDAHKSQLSLLGIDPTIGNVKPNNTGVIEDNENKLTCCVKTQLFSSSESYRLTISTSKVRINFSVFKFHPVKDFPPI